MKLRRLNNPRGWTSIPNAALEDSLSWRAVGLLAYLLSRPDGWETDSVRLASGEAKEGRDAVRTALAALEAAGYLHRVKVRRPAGMTLDGRYVGGQITTEWFVSDHPVDHPSEVIQLVDELAPDEADAGKSGPGSTGGDNAVENMGTDHAPTPEKPTPENPASLTSNKYPLEITSPGDQTTVAALPVEKVAGSAVAAPSGLAALAEKEPALPALSSTDSIALVSRLEPGIQMFALRAHLMGVLGYQLTFDQLGALVVEAHESSTPSRRGRLRDRDVVAWVEEFTSAPEPSVGSASVEVSGSAALPQRGLSAAEPPLRGGSMDQSEVLDFSTPVNP